jgi:outer membrane immunogenic protein
MRQMSARTQSLAVVGLILVFSTPSSAQNWSGYYLGANVGYAWGTSNATTITGCPSTAPPGYVCGLDFPASLANLPVVDGAGSGRMHPSSATGSLVAGYNWQSRNFVYGVEVDFGSFNLHASRSGSGSWPAGGASYVHYRV